MSIGERLTHFRKSKNMTQQELSNITGVNRVTIGNYERDARIPNISILGKLCSALDVDVNEVLYTEEYLIKSSLEEIEQYKRTKEEKASVEQVFIVDRLLELGLSFEEALDYGQITEEDYKYLTSDRLKRLTTVLHLVEE